jgi:RNA-binding protein
MTASPAPDLSSKQLAFLRSKAQRLEPAVKVGKDGVDDGFRRELGIALDRHELVKVRCGKQVVVDAAALATDVGAALVAKLGHVVVLYRPAAEPKLRLPS